MTNRTENVYGRTSFGADGYRKIKVFFFISAIFILLCSHTFLSFAGEWRTGAVPNENRWWYETDDGSFARDGWFWLDGNGDGVAECYYFDRDGWMFADTVTPDGYTVSADGAWIQGGLVQSRPAQNEATEKEAAMQISVQGNGHTIVFELNDSPAARSLYSQLPMTVHIENYSTNEKIFYPPGTLELGNTPLTRGGRAGGLAYFASWGNVILYYGTYGPYSGLYDLGTAVSGSEWIGTLSGEIVIETTKTSS